MPRRIRRRRPPHILANVATVVSLVVCLTTAALWVRSLWIADVAHLVSARGSAWVWSEYGTILLHLNRGESDGRPAPRPGWELRSGAAYPRDSDGSFGYARTGYTTYLYVSHGWIVFLSMLAPFTRVLRRRFWPPSAAPGLCPACGYDLRATPDRCPECGLDVPAA